MITATGKSVMKKCWNNTIRGVRATPSLMLNTLAARNSRTSEKSFAIWYRM